MKHVIEQLHTLNKAFTLAGRDIQNTKKTADQPWIAKRGITAVVHKHGMHGEGSWLALAAP